MRDFDSQSGKLAPLNKQGFHLLQWEEPLRITIRRNLTYNHQQ